jgi:hypothetical protein
MKNCRVKIYANKYSCSPIAKRLVSKFIDKDDDDLPINWFYSEDEALKSLKLKEAKRLEEYKHNQIEANLILDKVEAMFITLQKDNNCNIGYSMLGDTYGIHEDYMYISTTVNGHYYERRLND